MTADASPERGLQGLTILVVEDEALVSMLIETMLGDLGCRSVWYASGVSEALELLRQRTPDAAVLDLNLAGEPAYPIADRLTRDAVPFIFATGYGRDGLAPEWSATPVVQKPFERQDLAAALATVLQRRRASEIRR